MMLPLRFVCMWLSGAFIASMFFIDHVIVVMACIFFGALTFWLAVFKHEGDSH